jgi:ribosomal protein S18 acetylase RimI-like enzyme
MSVMIRQAEEADLPAILALYAQPEIDDDDVLSVDDAARIFRRFADYPDYRLFVAEEEGIVVGSFALLIMDNLGHLGAPSAVVEDVVVDPKRQGAGIGKTMVRAALTEARRKGCYKLALSANHKRDKAHAFYESLGFERHGYSFLVTLEETA